MGTWSYAPYAYGILNNAGVFQVSAGTGTTSLDSNWTINNTGTVQVQSGTLSLGGGGTSSGPFQVSPGAALQFNVGTYTLNAGSNVSGGGSVVLSGATVNFSGTSASTVTGNTLFSAGSIGGSGPVNFNNLAWSGGLISNTAGVTIAPGATLNISGAVVVGSGYGAVLNVGGTATMTGSGGIQPGSGYSNGTINIQNGGLFAVQGGAGFSQGNSGYAYGTLNNAGVLQISAGTGTTSLDSGWTFNNTGTVQVQSGTLSLGGGGTSSGPFQVSPSAELQFSVGTYNLNAGSNVTGGGSVVLSGATVNFSGTSAFDGDGEYDFQRGVDRRFRARELQQHGVERRSDQQHGRGDDSPRRDSKHLRDGWREFRQRRCSQRGRHGNHDGRRRDSSGADLLHQWHRQHSEWRAVRRPRGRGFSSGDYAYGTLNNAGVFQISAGTGTTSLDSNWTLNNTGTVQVQSGTLSLGGGGTSSGPFQVSPGATLQFNVGTYNLNAGSNVSGGGSVVLSGATVNFSGTSASTVTGNTIFSAGSIGGSGPVNFSNLAWSGGLISNTAGVTIAPGGTLSISGTVVVGSGNGGVLNVAGTATMTGSGGIQLGAGYSNGTVNIQNGGLFAVQGGAGFSVGT